VQFRLAVQSIILYAVYFCLLLMLAWVYNIDSNVNGGRLLVHESLFIGLLLWVSGLGIGPIVFAETCLWSAVF